MDSPNANSGTAPAKKWGCLKGCLIAAGVCTLLFCLMAFWVYRSISWLANAVEPQPPSCSPLALTEDEKEDVAQVMRLIYEAKTQKNLADISVTPAVFNGVVEKFIEDARKKNKPDAPVFLRGAFNGTMLNVKIAAPVNVQKNPEKAGQYYNVEADFDFEVVDGVITKANVHSMRLKGEEAPWLALKIANWVFEAFKKESAKQSKFPVIKLLKREGDDLHVVLDGAKMEN
jgi:hypothetical protein